MLTVRNTSNCGLYEVHNLVGFNHRTEKNYIRAIRLHFRYMQRGWTWPSQLVFSDAKTPNRRTPTYGEKLARLIEERNLGVLVSTDWRINPNSGNLIKIWMWAPNAEELERYCQ